MNGLQIAVLVLSIAVGAQVTWIGILAIFALARPGTAYRPGELLDAIATVTAALWLPAFAVCGAAYRILRPLRLGLELNGPDYDVDRDQAYNRRTTRLLLGREQGFSIATGEAWFRRTRYVKGTDVTAASVRTEDVEQTNRFIMVGWSRFGFTMLRHGKINIAQTVSDAADAEARST